MRVIGIDPGLRLTGFGVIDVDGPRLSYVASGVVRTPTADLPERLGVIFTALQEIVATHRPTVAAIEKVFVNVNPASTLLLGQARGAAICALTTGGIRVAEYTALQTKQATVGYGRASKTQVQAMVARLLRLSGTPAADAADALACAICHAHVDAHAARLATVAPELATQHLRVRRGRAASRP
jgi:crossover junction endodeoxyribonuclease RuvC